ncbi:hypothetical protein SDC9_145656 [bioreactor metagenome]|uniref:Uncharacterized protein n=1 Tax=bioreactor metagenome TaxID=1076179 RepID=A0A645EBH6_9ZZZZ
MGHHVVQLAGQRGALVLTDPEVLLAQFHQLPAVRRSAHLEPAHACADGGRDEEHQQHRPEQLRPASAVHGAGSHQPAEIERPGQAGEQPAGGHRSEQHHQGAGKDPGHVITGGQDADQQRDAREHRPGGAPQGQVEHQVHQHSARHHRQSSGAENVPGAGRRRADQIIDETDGDEDGERQA